MLASCALGSKRDRSKNRLRFALCREQHAIELRLDLGDSQKLQLKFFQCAFELLSHLHELFNLRRSKVSCRTSMPLRTAVPLRSGGTGQSCRASWSPAPCAPA